MSTNDFSAIEAIAARAQALGIETLACPVTEASTAPRRVKSRYLLAVRNRCSRCMSRRCVPWAGA